MCIGIPMQIVEPGPHFSVCHGSGETRTIDMALVGEQPAGTWVLVFLDAAREVITAGDAAQDRRRAQSAVTCFARRDIGRSPLRRPGRPGAGAARSFEAAAHSAGVRHDFTPDRALTAKHGFACVNERNLDDFLHAHEETVLFFAGDSERLAETDDVAVILPETPETVRRPPHTRACREARRTGAATSFPVQCFPGARVLERRRLSRRDLPRARLAGLSDRNRQHPDARALGASALSVP